MAKKKASARKEIYLKALEALENGTAVDNNHSSNWVKYHSGLCELVAIIEEGKGVYCCHPSESMKEFHLFEPINKDRDHAFWWKENDRESRKMALALMIAMVEY